MTHLAIPVAVTVLAGVSAVAHVRAEYRGPRWLGYLCKPLTTTLLFALAVWARGPVGPRYQWGVAAGLALSLAGDIFLMLPKDRFVAGLSSFLLAHVAYLVAFTTDCSLGATAFLFVPFAVLGVAVLSVLWPRLGRLRGPVAVYVVVIMAMAGQAAGRAWTLRTTLALLAAAGAALFVVSDTLLALDRFRSPFRSARALVMGTYVLAQWLIALSVGAGLAAA